MDITEVTDYDIGRHYYEAGRPFEDCDTEEQRDGWQDAAADANEKGIAADFSCMMQAQEEGEYINWNGYFQEIDRLARHATG